ncbi:hypothetical protein BN946_scf184499.g20 [Trametes cinnabarina]|uniref:C2 domain-containing protein n=1 Tax=Pycnoporus cinnabarinus TaxID=5643 RepID=A0A060S2G3_PYCCI|nr:hypothetical protein BN946_scf184499.g20 [Trametes cinnabarina]
MHFTNPWHVTVIRTRGLSFVRPDKSWRPIVKITVVDGSHEYVLPEVVLGSDGQNSDFKSFVPVHGVNRSTSLVLQVFHRSQTKKKHRKPTLVGSAKLPLAEIINKYPLPHSRPVHHDVRLSCPPPQRKSPTVGGRRQHSATLTLKFVVPNPTQPSRPPSPIDNAYSEMDGMFSDGASSSKDPADTLVASVQDEFNEQGPWDQQQPESLPGALGLRRRRRRLTGFHVDSDTDQGASESSVEGPWPRTPIDDYFGAAYEDEDAMSGWTKAVDGGFEGAVVSPSMIPLIPLHEGDNVSMTSMRRSLSFAESVVDVFAPYHELREADQDNDLDKAEKVLGRLLTEWYVVGASLLALAGIDAAVFGFAPGALFVVDGFSKSVVAIGAIAAGIGLVTDTWFLVLYSGANAEKFQVRTFCNPGLETISTDTFTVYLKQRLAKDVYKSYFFFCLTCRLPAVCMFISAMALMFFLLGVAWAAWPAAVLVMSFVAGMLLTSQFLVFGIHRFIEAVIWIVRVVWRKIARPLQPNPPQTHSGGLPHMQQGRAPRPSRTSQNRERVEMPIPEPARA